MRTHLVAVSITDSAISCRWWSLLRWLRICFQRFCPGACSGPHFARYSFNYLKNRTYGESPGLTKLGFWRLLPLFQAWLWYSPAFPLQDMFAVACSSTNQASKISAEKEEGSTTIERGTVAGIKLYCVILIIMAWFPARILPMSSSRSIPSPLHSKVHIVPPAILKFGIPGYFPDMPREPFLHNILPADPADHPLC